MFSVIVSSSVLIILIIITRALFRGRVGNCLIYALWLLVAARLVMPVPELVIQKITGCVSSGIISSISIMNATGIIEKSIFTEDGSRTKTSISLDNLQDNAADDSVAGIGCRKILDYVMFGLWLAGFAVIITVQIISGRKLRRRLLENREQADAAQGIYVTGSINTPVLFRSRGITLDIYIPVNAAYNSEIVKYAVLHENTHRKHGDIWWSYLRNILVAVYWFNPLVWAAAILSKRDAEYACDSGVIKAMDEKEKIAYGNSLLWLVQPGKVQDVFCTAASMNLVKTEMEERIIMIKKGIKKSITATTAVCVAAALAAAITFTEAKADSMVQKVLQDKVQEQWTSKNITEAKKAVQKYVKKRNSKNKHEYYDMKNLHYDKAYSSIVLSDNKYSRDKDKMVVLLSGLNIYYKKVDKTKDILIDGPVYPNWMWILKQNNNGNWKVEECRNSIFLLLSSI